MWTDTRVDSGGSLSRTLTVVWITFKGTSVLPSANHYDLPGPQSIFGVSQEPPKCAHARWILPKRHVGRTSLGVTSL